MRMHRFHGVDNCRSFCRIAAHPNSVILRHQCSTPRSMTAMQANLAAIFCFDGAFSIDLADYGAAARDQRKNVEYTVGAGNIAGLIDLFLK